MLFKIGDTVFDPNTVPCAIVFCNDEEKQFVVEILNSMPVIENSDRWFAAYPKNFFDAKAFDKWSQLSQSEKKLLKQWKKKEKPFNMSNNTTKQEKPDPKDIEAAKAVKDKIVKSNQTVRK